MDPAGPERAYTPELASVNVHAGTSRDPLSSWTLNAMMASCASCMLRQTARIDVTVVDTENETKQTYASISSVEGRQHVVAGRSEYGVVAKDGFGEV